MSDKIKHYFEAHKHHICPRQKFKYDSKLTHDLTCLIGVRTCMIFLILITNFGSDMLTIAKLRIKCILYVFCL